MPSRILNGIRVLDFTRFYAGAFATRWLADLGADVLKIEPPGGEFRELNLVRGRDGKLTPKLHAETPAVGGLHGGFLHSNSGKRGICINIKAEGAFDLVKRLIAASDIVVESFTPHVFRAWGLTYEEMCKLKPDIILVQASGFGQDTPDSRAVCTVPVASAMSGFQHGIGYPDDYPLSEQFGIGDTISATVTALGILAALVHKLRTGEGQHVDTAMVDSLTAMDGIGLPHAAISRGEYKPMRNGRSIPLAMPCAAFRVKGEYLTVQAGGGGQGDAMSGWGRLCKLMGREDLIEDPGWATDEARADKEAEFTTIFEEWLDRNFPTAEEAAAELQSHQILASKVYSPAEILTHPHYLRRQMIVDVSYPLLGPLATISTPNKYSKTPVQVGRAPLLGEHNEIALSEWLDLSEAEVREMYDIGVLEQDTLVAALHQASDLDDRRS
jgi:CoA:oxalate CoA-transferase